MEKARGRQKETVERRHAATAPNLRTRGRFTGVLPALTAGILLCASAHGEEAIPDVLVFGGDANYPPFEWVADGDTEGFNIELARMLTDRSGLEVQFELGAWPDILDRLDRGEIDVVPMFVSEARKEKYLFTDTFFYQTHALFGRPETPPLENPERFEGLRLAVERRSLAQMELDAGSSVPDSVSLHDNTLEALRAVVDGRADYALLAATTTGDLIGRHSLPLARKSPPFWPRGYAFAVLRDRPQLSALLNEQFALVMARGDYLALYERWSSRLEVGADYQPGYVRLIQFGLLGLLVLALVSVAWNLTLRRRVARRTESIHVELRRRYQAEQRVRELHRLDPQTGHHNARQFHAEVDESLLEKPGEPMVLMVVRLIDLEQVYRSAGHSRASRMIREFGDALREVASLHSAHLGRGVFAVLLAGTECRPLLEGLARRTGAGEFSVQSGFAAGSASYPVDDVSADGLLQKAEAALAAAIDRQLTWLPFEVGQASGDGDFRDDEPGPGSVSPGS